MLGSDPDPSNVKPGENNPFVLDVRIGGGGNGDVFSLKQPVRLAADGPIVYSPTGLVAKEIRVFESRFEEVSLQDEFRDMGGKFDDVGYQKAYSKKVEESVLKTAIENAMQARIGDNNPHVPRLMGFTQVDGKAYVIMQEMGGGGVDKFAEKNAPFEDTSLPPQERTLRLKGQLHVFSGMVRGVAAMHDRGLVHCDIKPQNSMIDRETNEGMVIDLGNTVRVDSAIGLGTPHFMSPEQTRRQAPAHPSSDVWSLGATLYMQMGFTLFPNSRNPTGSLRNGEDGTLGAPPHWTTPDPSLAPIKAFIMACFNQDPNLRPTAAQMVQALNDEPIITAPDGFGLPSGSTDLLDFLRPTSASMAGGRDAFAQLMDRP
jgi:serine/threonine protein kinase